MIGYKASQVIEKKENHGVSAKKKKKRSKIGGLKVNVYFDFKTLEGNEFPTEIFKLSGSPVGLT